MTRAETLQQANSGIGRTIELLRQVQTAHPKAEAEVRELLKAEDASPGARALAQVLLAMGQFAIQADDISCEVLALVAAMATANQLPN